MLIFFFIKIYLFRTLEYQNDMYIYIFNDYWEYENILNNHLKEKLFISLGWEKDRRILLKNMAKVKILVSNFNSINSSKFFHFSKISLVYNH